MSRPSVRSDRAARDRLDLAAHADRARLDQAARLARRRRTARHRAQATAAGLVAGYLIDAAVGDPRRFGPIAGYGRAVSALDRRTQAPAGQQWAIAVGTPVLAAAVGTLLTRRRPLARAVLVAATTWAALGGTAARREARAVAESLDVHDLAVARRRLPHPTGNSTMDPIVDVTSNSLDSTMDEGDVAAVAIATVAADTSTTVVVPLFWAAVAGLPGLVAGRAVNALDAMLAQRDATLDVRLSTAAARAAVAVNLIPSRLTGALTVAAAPAVGGHPGRTAWRWLSHGFWRPGQPAAAMAGALGVRLDHRPGDGRTPNAADIRRAVTVSTVIGAGTLVLAALRALRRGSPPRKRRGRA